MKDLQLGNCAKFSIAVCFVIPGGIYGVGVVTWWATAELTPVSGSGAVVGPTDLSNMLSLGCRWLWWRWWSRTEIELVSVASHLSTFARDNDVELKQHNRPVNTSADPGIPIGRGQIPPSPFLPSTLLLSTRTLLLLTQVCYRRKICRDWLTFNIYSKDYIPNFFNIILNFCQLCILVNFCHCYFFKFNSLFTLYRLPYIFRRHSIECIINVSLALRMRCDFYRTLCTLLRPVPGTVWLQLR